MKSRDFVYWLQGFFEVAGAETLSTMQVEKIKRHLALVFQHEIDPSMGGPDEQKKLNETHSPSGQTLYRC